MWLYDSLSFVKSLKNQEFTIHFDATGSVIKPIAIATQPIYYYAVVVQCHESFQTSFSVADLLSETHSVPRIQFFLQEWMRNVNKPLQPDCVVTDFSLALIHAVVLSFNGMSLSSYLHNLIVSNF